MLRSTIYLRCCWSDNPYSAISWNTDTLAAYTAISSLLQLLRIPYEVIPDVRIYGRIFTLGFIIYGLMESTILIFSAVGDTVTPMKVTMLGAFMNIVLDPIFIFGLGPLPRLGIAGAVIATLISYLTTTSLVVYLLVRGIRRVKLRPTHLRSRQELVKKLVKIGFPISISSVSDAAEFTALTGTISIIGSATLASWGIGSRRIF